MADIRDYEPLFGDWRVAGKPLGIGAFGEVYEVEKQELGIRLKAAVKRIPLPDEKLLASVRSEVQTMLELSGDKHIVAIRDFCVEQQKRDGGHDVLILMELLTPLSKVLEKGMLPVPEVVKLGEQMCLALERCAEHGLIHRDIKPDNILLTDRGDYKLGDFGIARAMEKSQAYSNKGTPEYKAPEVALFHSYNHRADIYSLGMTLYYLLNGNRLPFDDREDGLLRRVDKKESLPAIPWVSAKLMKVIQKACAHNPDKRYAKAAEFGEALRAAMKPDEKREKPAPPPKEPKEKKKRAGTGLSNKQKKVIAILAAAAVLVAGGMSVLFALWAPGKAPPDWAVAYEKLIRDSHAGIFSDQIYWPMEGRPLDNFVLLDLDNNGIPELINVWGNHAVDAMIIDFSQQSAITEESVHYFYATELYYNKETQQLGWRGTEFHSGDFTTYFTGQYANKSLVENALFYEVPRWTVDDEASISDEPLYGRGAPVYDDSDDNSGFGQIINAPLSHEEYLDLLKEFLTSSIKIPMFNSLDAVSDVQDCWLYRNGFAPAKTEPTAVTIEAEAKPIQIGDTVHFGQYDWLVLDVNAQDNSALLIAQNIVELRPYNNRRTDVTWEKSTLRKWLNSEFYNRFSMAEKAKIQFSTVVNENNSEHNTNGGNSTRDKIFLLSLTEVEKYFSSDGERAAQFNEASDWWWLRSPGGSQNSAAHVLIAGSVGNSGTFVDGNYGVRPAMRVSMESVSAETTNPPPNYMVGDIVHFGQYDWQVIDVDAQDGSALLITEEIISKHTYHDKRTAVTWESSALRQWLNDEFYNSFSPAEQARIKTTTRVTEDNPEYGTAGGNDTADKVFLLSLVGVRDYFDSDEARAAKFDGEIYWWWLRSPGSNTNRVTVVDHEGKAYNTGLYVNNDTGGVRPALWISR